jgi:hypothetical protein
MKYLFFNRQNKNHFTARVQRIKKERMIEPKMVIIYFKVLIFYQKSFKR